MYRSVVVLATAVMEDGGCPFGIAGDTAGASLPPPQDQFGEGLSWADLIVLAGNTAIEDAGGRPMKFCGGRSDALDRDAAPRHSARGACALAPRRARLGGREPSGEAESMGGSPPRAAPRSELWASRCARPEVRREGRLRLSAEAGAQGWDSDEGAAGRRTVGRGSGQCSPPGSVGVAPRLRRSRFAARRPQHRQEVDEAGFLERYRDADAARYGHPGRAADAFAAAGAAFLAAAGVLQPAQPPRTHRRRLRRNPSSCAATGTSRSEQYNRMGFSRVAQQDYASRSPKQLQHMNAHRGRARGHRANPEMVSALACSYVGSHCDCTWPSPPHRRDAEPLISAEFVIDVCACARRATVTATLGSARG